MRCGLLVLLLVSVSACSLPSGTLRVDRSDASHLIELEDGQELVVELPELGAGDAWRIVDGAPHILRAEASSLERFDSDSVRTWRFSARRNGAGALAFARGDQAPSVRFLIAVQ